MNKPRVRLHTLSFGQAVQAFANNTIETMDRLHRTVVFNLGERIIAQTPFGDPTTWKYPAPANYVPGLARGNWQTRVGELAAGPIDRRGGGEAVAELRENTGEAGDTVYMSNSVPYIMRLEYEGWSGQAPAGMVRINVAAWQNMVREALAMVKQ